ESLRLEMNSQMMVIHFTLQSFVRSPFRPSSFRRVLQTPQVFISAPSFSRCFYEADLQEDHRELQEELKPQ
ncbi:uncharacterized, partial [Tachysurus ichikawai]